MIAGILDFIFGGALSLVLLLLGLLPTVDLSQLPLEMPQGVQDALGALNWLVPIGDLITILSWWVGLLLAVNVFLVVSHIIGMVKK